MTPESGTASAVRYSNAMVFMHWFITGAVVLHLTVALISSLLRHLPTTLAVMDLHRSIGLTIFLLAMCWWIFIKQLDIRVAVWPLQY